MITVACTCCVVFVCVVAHVRCVCSLSHLRLLVVFVWLCACVWYGVLCLRARSAVCLCKVSVSPSMPNENRSLVDYRRERIEILILISTTREWRCFFSPKFCQPTPQQSAKGLSAEKKSRRKLGHVGPDVGPVLAHVGA